MDFNADQLKHMAVKVVSTFIVNKVPLSKSIAEMAEEKSLSSEQIKRLIEVSNQVAYLKLLEKASDRTFEFPLASVAEVMAILATPEDIMSKEASFKKSPLSIVTEGEMEKVASDDTPYLDTLSHSDKVSLVNKELYKSKRQLEKVAAEETVLLQELLVKAADFREDELFIEKVAFVVEEEEDSKLLTKISHLVYGESREATGEELFYDSDVEDTQDFVGMFKRAYEIVEEKKELEDNIARAEELLHKQAVAGAVTSVAKNIAGKASTAASSVKSKAPGVADKALKAGESATFLVDQMNEPKRDVWKSIRG